MLCENCGNKLSKRAKSCRACGANTIPAPQVNEESLINDSQETVQWKIGVSLFHPVFLKQVGYVVVAIIGLVALVIGLSSGGIITALVMVGVMVGILILACLFLLLLYRGKYLVEFVLDHKGVLYRKQARQAKRDRLLGTLALIIGLLAKRPFASRALRMDQSRKKVFLQWDHIKNVKYKPESNTILLRGRSMEQIALFCTDENYSLVAQIVSDKTKMKG